MGTNRKTYVADWERLRAQRMLARDALLRAGVPDFKRQSSAKWADYTRLEHGGVLACVQHDNIKGCTPEMIKWFFEHLGCCTTWNGVDFTGPEISLYHLWHHRDHVAVTPLTSSPEKENLGFQQGSRSRIHELTNEVNDVIYFEMETVCLDEHEFTFHVMFGNRATGHVKHIYEPAGNGDSTFYAETKLLVENGGAFFNKILIPRFYSKQAGVNWIHHNIQETGRMQDILPVLYTNQDKVFFDPDFIKFD